MYYYHKLFNIFYQKYGNSPQSIIILPGWGNNRPTFDYIINNLKDYFTIYIFDYPGFGQSSFPNHHLTIFNYAQVINDFQDENNLNNPIIMAHSFGGRLTILLASIFKRRFKKIILIDSAGIKNFSFKKTFRKYLYKFLKKLKFLFPNQKKYLTKLLQIFGSTDFKNINPSMQKTFINIVNTDLTKHIKAIKDETLIIWGVNDQETPYRDALKFNKLIKNSYLIPIANSGHFPYLDYPQHIFNIIYEYLKEDINHD